ncbi:hypothetical protein QUF94_15830 [Peribacillus sp. NJ4]|uniref:hypothetical protein n=1 Tax=Peribacillus TaxID=2675229 RepID=UPI0025A1056A|nr:MULTISPECIES: hypothetical protein [unclassified Peribacillus]MDM5212895.1 hypothetical protein [Peribacillus sp. NJ4]MDM5223287.1 hypothetical protein [Peribacillus sp. NJ11]
MKGIIPNFSTEFKRAVGGRNEITSCVFLLHFSEEGKPAHWLAFFDELKPL